MEAPTDKKASLQQNPVSEANSKTHLLVAPSKEGSNLKRKPFWDQVIPCQQFADISNQDKGS